MRRTPAEALEAAMWHPHLICTNRYRGPNSKPGEVILDLPESERALLRDLKSDDIANIRSDALLFL